jgi:hypothetical protein
MTIIRALPDPDRLIAGHRSETSQKEKGRADGAPLSRTPRSLG